MLLSVVLLGCTGTPSTDAVTAPGEAACDGRYQTGDGDGMDAAFDRDGDGYVDARNAECVANYGENRLDCDDDDPDIHPDALEIQCNEIDEDCNPDTLDALDGDSDGTPSCYDCDDTDPTRSPAERDVCWDLIDNDCDNVVDQDCGPNYGGRFELSQRVRYGCMLGIIQIDFDEVGVLWEQPYASMYSIGGVQPGTLQGTIEEDGSFSYEGVVDLGTAASCAEHYRFTGRYVDVDTMVFDFEARFVPHALGACLSCDNRVWRDLTGVRTQSN